jgi:thioredoxin reductase (NADPH)
MGPLIHLMDEAQPFDCLIVGGGPAGLTAATYLGRFRRSVLLVDAGESRLDLIPLSRNIPGFPDGVSGPDFRRKMEEQADRYGAQRVSGVVISVKTGTAGFEVETSAGNFSARQVLLATGVKVIDPELEGLPEAILRGAVRYCPICDGFEAIGARVAVLGGRPGSIEEAQFLRTYVEDLTFVAAEPGSLLSPAEAEAAELAGIRVEHRVSTGLELAPDGVRIGFASGDALRVDIVYPCLGTEPRSDLAQTIGAAISESGELLTDKHLQTCVRGLYAAGDVLRGLDQVASACGQAAIAATAIHNALRRLDDESAGALAASPQLHDIDADSQLR